MTNRTAWIEKQTNGRFAVIATGVLFPGYQNRYTTTYADRSSARRMAEREGLKVQAGNCPLPKVTAEMKVAYHNRGITQMAERLLA